MSLLTSLCKGRFFLIATYIIILALVERTSCSETLSSNSKVNTEEQRILTLKLSGDPVEPGVFGMPYHELHHKEGGQCTKECNVKVKSPYAQFNTSVSDLRTLFAESDKNGMNLVSRVRKVATAMLTQAALLMCKKGDIVETGVFTGGSSAIIMKYLLELDQCDRKFYIFDSFEGLPAPEKEDSVNTDLLKGGKGGFAASEVVFYTNMVKMNVWDDDKMVVAKGKKPDVSCSITTNS